MSDNYTGQLGAATSLLGAMELAGVVTQAAVVVAAGPFVSIPGDAVYMTAPLTGTASSPSTGGFDG